MFLRTTLPVIACALALSACGIGGGGALGTNPVPEGPEPNNAPVDGTPITVAFPLLLTGSIDYQSDLFKGTAPGPGTLTLSCISAVAYSFGGQDVSTGANMGAGKCSDGPVSFPTDGGEVWFTTQGVTITPYQLRVDFVSA